jgi:hypothetical protein
LIAGDLLSADEQFIYHHQLLKPVKKSFKQLWRPHQTSGNLDQGVLNV